VVTHPRVREVYVEYLFALHAVMRGIAGVMESALERSRAAAGTDPVADLLATYLKRHIAEERGHDVWVRVDLEQLGVDPADPEHRVPSPSVAAMVGSLYFWVLHVHPVAVLGHLAVAEGHPPTAEMVRRLRAASGVTRNAFRTLDEHAELDPAHADELAALIDSLPLTPEQERLVVVAAMSGAGLMARALEDVVDVVDESG
jgi:pyrroloquinoline quinone (PQQ) biosynthesis protein C